MTFILAFNLQDDVGPSISFQKWILEVRIILKSGISFYAYQFKGYIVSASDMLISYYGNKNGSLMLPSWEPSLNVSSINL